MFGFVLVRTAGPVTTTPRPTKLVKELIADLSTIVTRGSTYQNKANLANTLRKGHQEVRGYEIRASGVNGGIIAG